MVLVILRDRNDPMSPDWPPDIRDWRMQVVLRVVQRSMEAGDKATRVEYGGERVTGRRNWLNAVNERAAEWAVRCGLPRDAAFELLGLGRRQGFRARERSTDRRK
jgi:hypothetical protein